MRGSFYVDGYNLYHAIDDLGLPYLKWNNLRALAELIAKKDADIQRVVFCTAYFSSGDAKRSRHEKYVQAQMMFGVDVLLGHVIHEPQSCSGCDRVWSQPREKQTDVNLSLALVEDAIDDKYDVAYLVTADSDQVAAVKAVRRRAPSKKVIIVTPVGREPSHHLDAVAHGRIKMSVDHLDRAVMKGTLITPPHRTIFRPQSYDPPSDWFHPDDRRSRR